MKKISKNSMDACREDRCTMCKEESLCPCEAEGCYRNVGTTRVDHVMNAVMNAAGTSWACKTQSECQAFANGKGAAYYGMEYPQGCPTKGEAQCLYLTETEVQKWGSKVQDTECNVANEKLNQGGSYRVYVRPVSV